MDSDLMCVSLLAPAFRLAKAAHIFAQALANIHAQLKTLMSTIDLQTMSDI